MFKKNRLLHQFITELDAQIADTQSPQELLEVIEEIQQQKNSLKFSFIDQAISLILLLGIFIGSLYFFYITDENFLLFTTVASLFALIILAFNFKQRKTLVSNLSDRLFRQDLLFDNHLTPLKSHPTLTLRALQSRFHEFSLGNHGQEISDIFEGKYMEISEPFIFHGYHFRYVDETFSGTKSHQYPKRTQNLQPFKQSHRYGIIIPFEAPAELVITELPLPLQLRQSQYKDPNLPKAFRRKYRIHTTNSQFAEHFLNPLVLPLIKSLSHEFTDISIEIRNRTELLFSFSNPDLLKCERRHSLHNIDAFSVEIRGVTKAKKLDLALSTLYRISKYVQ
ncbi:hypothetical protein [Ignatzschineria sp. LJL83]